MIKNQEHTPLMKQYYEIKQSYSDCLLLFQVGDFYELFCQDAQQAAAFLGIALTARGKNKGAPIPLCGVPVHAIDHYLSKLVRGGFKVAICNQTSDPKPGAITQRAVTQVLTPGTLTDSALLDDRSPSYLFSFYPAGDSWGLVFSELLTAQIFTTTIPALSDKLLEAELIRFFPDEVLIPAGKNAVEFQAYFKRLGYCTTIVHSPDQEVLEVESLEWISSQFSSSMSEHVWKNESIKLALRYFYAYMCRNQRAALKQFSSIFFYQPDDFLILDSATQRNLELTKNLQNGTTKNSLFDVIDCAKTPMGSRMIKKWLQRPLVEKEAIVQRQDVVTLFFSDRALANEVEQRLVTVGDIERVVGRIALERGTYADYKALARVLLIIPEFKALMHNQSVVHTVLMRIINEHLGDFNELADFLKKALHDDADGEGIIKDGFDERLDQMRVLMRNGNSAISQLESQEQVNTGIASLKVRYNNVQGYYIEVTNANLSAIPEGYRRIQTLVGRERFMTAELQVLQYDIERSRKDIVDYEQELFARVKSRIASAIAPLRKSVHAIAYLDALLSLARLAYDNGYVRPVFADGRDIIIKNGRHPVVEQRLLSAFIPNDTILTDEQSLWIVTGPNMGGKSTYLRQVALICIMAHIGSFVPAESAELSLLDRIFTRIGATDNVAEGKSTFLIEMEETATICTQATAHSLVILDEVGRGTSTFDGLAIAQAVVEHLYQNIKSRSLFATHYHELTYLPAVLPGIVPYHAASKKTQEGILFLYKILPGVAHGSFGIEVAKIANIPSGIVVRAAQLVGSFSAGSLGHDNTSNLLQDQQEQSRMSNENIRARRIFAAFEGIDFENLSPKKALDLLWELKEI